MGKQPRRKPQIHTGNSYIKREATVYYTCSTDGCKNIIASWAAPKDRPVKCIFCERSSAR